MADAFVKQDLPHRWELFMSYRTAIGSIYTTAKYSFISNTHLNTEKAYTSTQLGGRCYSRVYRCYHVWNGKIWIPLVPGVLSVIDTGIGYASVAATKLGSGVLIANGYSHEVIVADDLGYLFLAMNAFNNVVLTALIAGKIWSLNRVHSQLLGTGGGDKRLNAIVSIFLSLVNHYLVSIESGTIYPVALIICLIIQVKQSPATMDPILLQIVGIAPTLIMVRTYLSLDSRIPQKDAETELGKANLSSRVTSDIKDTLSASTPSPYQPIFTLPSDYVYTPLLSPQSSYGGGSSMYSADISHNSFQPTMKTANYEDGEIADGTGFIPEKTFVELRYQALSLQSSPAQMLFSSEKGTSGEPSSLRSAYFKDNDRYFAH
ncbi:hypothetical protein GYMLUDRAFT_63329 [Collybiopsis luxurians FD-317 M1]|uniref:Uncharacterized protein n=1 Tax=Collybiopsis luxurians FD-317 M1 TaxID=944289 RepID=A0A0D0AUD4_9AGAR|nr:hypothetical protein GYMLUDRAFT_63329 [Collybiopsis luxurians FD-317 M1]